MKRIIALFIAGLFGTVHAQENPGTKLNMSAAAQQSMVLNSQKYIGKSCLVNEHMAVWDAQTSANPASLQTLYKAEVARMKAGAQLDHLDPFILKNEFVPGRGGYIYLGPLKRNAYGYYTEIVMMNYQNAPHVLVYVCVVPPRR